MKKMALIVIILLNISSVASASAQLTELPFMRENESSTTNQDNQGLILADQLRSLSEIDQFKLSVDWVNQRSQEANVKVQILGQQSSGDAVIQLEFFNRNAQPSSYAVKLYAYDHFRHVYVSVYEWLLATAYLDQLQFAAQLATSLEAYRDYFVAIDANQLAVNLDQGKLLDRLLVLPNLSQVQRLTDEEIYQLGDQSFVQLQRLNIPENFFRGIANLALDLRLELKADLDHFTLLPKLTVNQNNRGLNMMVQIEGDISDSLQVDQVDQDFVELPTYTQVTGLYQNLLIDKLVTMQMTFDQGDQTYALKLAGLTENFNLNLFSPETSNFKTYEFESNLFFEPYEWEMPAMLDLKRMSQAELDWLTQSIWQEVRTSETSE